MPFENFEKGNGRRRNNTASHYTDVILNWALKINEENQIFVNEDCLGRDKAY
jgi:hypothetical protein